MKINNQANANNQDSPKIKELKEKLLYEKKNACICASEEEIKAADSFCSSYIDFLNNGKTEREACAEAVKIAEKAGFVRYKVGEKYPSGAKIYSVNRGKAVILAVIGSEPVENGVNIIASHIDSPRMDLKPNPLYEDNQIAYFKTHYYGGIKKYQWAAIPLALHGVVIDKNNKDYKTIEICIGEDDGDPVFTVTDLLPHLAAEQYKRKANEIIKGEELNVLIGSRPFKDGEDSSTVKLSIMAILNEKYGITEHDFLSAELEIVPAFKASDVGFDRSIIGGYGQDDRVCAYTSLSAIIECSSPKKTAVCVLADKEEIGSFGNTGLGSDYLLHFIEDLAESADANPRTVLRNSKCLSADVCAAHDPTFPDVTEKNNAAFMNHGAVITKYTGARGKSATNDAGAEYTAEICRIFDDNGVIWQTGELGKVDAGGGGTVAMLISKLNIDTIDVGVPVLSMHSPMELTAKIDVYMAYRGFSAFYGC